MSFTRRASPFLLLALILSHTQVVVQAQKAAVGSLPNALTTQDIAEAVSKAFGAALDNSSGRGTTGVKPGEPGTQAAGTQAAAAQPASNTSTRSSTADSTSSSADMAQSAAGSGAGLKILDAYQELLSSVKVSDIGDGANLQRLMAAAAKLQDAYAAVSGVVGPDAVNAGLQRFIGVEQLLLQTVGTALGDLGLVAGLLALACFILVAVAGGLVAGAGGIFVAINSQGLASAVAARDSEASDPADTSFAGIRSSDTNGTADSTNTTNSTAAWWEADWFKQTENTVDEASMRIVNWAFNSSDNNALELALGVLDVAHSLLAPVSSS